MSDYHIRLYEDSDYKVVRELFARGMNEHSHDAFHHAISVPRNWLFMLVMFLVSFWITGSVIMPLLVLITELSFLWICSRYIYSSYVDQCLSDDMLDIQKYYLQRDGGCFWVAESSGVVVGTVAAVPSSNSLGEKHTELKRLTVTRSHRGKGIAKALCRTVIDFARQRGCEAVVLETSSAQIDAQKLYEKIGFFQTHIIRLTFFTGRLLDFTILFYRYNIPTNR
ncbi:probable N-acetyltransferase CML1 [Pelobates fuscus]|uniref:probable N-acetyltransferase CML1 n=1 Tax=Pelobates fuscus TaxID=191477 RepID=UPI002FE4986B